MRHIPLSLLLLAAFALAGCQPRGTAGPGNDTVPAAPSAGADYQALYDSLGKDLADNLARWPNHQDKYIRPVRDGRGFQYSWAYAGFLAPGQFRYWVTQAWSSANNALSVRVVNFSGDTLNAPSRILIDTVFEANFFDAHQQVGRFGLHLPVLCVDINGDTVLDILVINNTVGGNFARNSYILWLGNRTTEAYTYIPGFDTLLNPAYDPQTNRIVDRLFHSQMSNSLTMYTSYQWDSDTLVPVQRVSRDLYFMAPNPNHIIPVDFLYERYNRILNSWDTVYQGLTRIHIDANRPPINFNAYCPGCDAAIPIQALDYNLRRPQ